MKLANIVLYVCLAGGLGGCAGGELPPDQGKTLPIAVPITLQAGSMTKAVVDKGMAFNPLLLCSNKSKQYEKLRWHNNASVSAEGVVAYSGFDDGKGPTYPYEEGFPFDVYVSGVHPQGADLDATPNAATYTISGEDDIMYAPEVFGNYQDGQRIHGNSNPSKDKPLVFGHLLTQLQFKAFRVGGAAVGQFKITKITIKDVPTTFAVSLADGSATMGEKRNSIDVQLNGKLITSDNVATPDEVGYALVPPADSYDATLVTSFGTFDIVIKTNKETILDAGKAHAITLKLIDDGVVISTVTVASWMNVESGDIDL